MKLHQATDEGRKCECGAAIREDDRNTLCPKCRARIRWHRRTEGRRTHPRPLRTHGPEGR